MKEYEFSFRWIMIRWWWFVLWSLFDVSMVFLDIYTNNVSWSTWLLGFLALFMALVAGSYPVKDPKEKEEVKE